jgi:ACT domain-containing protein
MDCCAIFYVLFMVINPHSPMTKKRIKSLEFHIANDDCFGTLATVLDLLRQELEAGKKIEDCPISLKKMTDELMYLQYNYKITGIK